MESKLSAWDLLSRTVLSSAQARAVDRIAVEQYRMHPLVLMENAALNATNWILSRFGRPGRAVVLCGTGNNGGDGFAITRHLRYHGWRCRVFATGGLERLSEDAAANCGVLHAEDRQMVQFYLPDVAVELPDDLSAQDIVIDAMLGTGATGAPRSPMAQWIDWANASNAARIAIDVPTGIDADRGIQDNVAYFAASATLTFVARKPAMVTHAADSIFGEIAVLPIGVPADLMEEILRRRSKQ